MSSDLKQDILGSNKGEGKNNNQKKKISLGEPMKLRYSLDDSDSLDFTRG
jgi:hypothetical protein